MIGSTQVKVALIDTACSGHHVPYARDIAGGLLGGGLEGLAVGPLGWCNAMAATSKAVPVHWHDDQSTLGAHPMESRVEFVRSALRASADAGAGIAHFLYFDEAIGALQRSSVPLGMKVVATLHWYPFLGLLTRGPKQALKGLIWLRALRLLDARNLTLIVHSVAAKQALEKWGIEHVHAVSYPSDVAGGPTDPHSREQMRARLKVTPDTRLVLCFGGTRRDKGADLAIAALAGTDPRIKLLIAGAEHDFDRQMLLDLATRHGVSGRVLLRLGHIPETEVAATFLAADAVLLPYRPVFAGQSGPLTIAGALGLTVIAADLPVLRETVESFGLGRTFRAGDVGDLRRALDDSWPVVTPTARQKYITECSPQRFGTRHLEIYGQAIAYVSADRRRQESAA